MGSVSSAYGIRWLTLIPSEASPQTDEALPAILWERRLGRRSRRGFWPGMASIPGALGAAPGTTSPVPGVVGATGRSEASPVTTTRLVRGDTPLPQAPI